MTTIKLDVEARLSERIQLAVEFLKEQEKVPKNRRDFQKLLNAFSRKTATNILRNDELLRALKHLPNRYTEKWHALCQKHQSDHHQG